MVLLTVLNVNSRDSQSYSVAFIRRKINVIHCTYGNDYIPMPLQEIFFVVFPHTATVSSMDVPAYRILKHHSLDAITERYSRNMKFYRNDD